MGVLPPIALAERSKHTISQQRPANRRNNPNGYPPPLPNEVEVRVVQACGLRRAELLNLRVRDIHQDGEGRVWIHVAKQAGRREREVPILAGREQMILARMQNARLFPDFPEQVDVQSARRKYASTLYYQLLMVSQNPPLFREYDEKAVREVMQALGHTDLSIVCRCYLHLRNAPTGQMKIHRVGLEPPNQE